MLRRRRPLLRAAMVGGAGYAAGRRMSAQAQHEAAQDEQLAYVQQGQGQSQTQAAPAAQSNADRIQALTQLKDLLDSGVLTQEEFDAEKRKLLQSG
jgi:membrane protease subunit (stomatin/prohibitin family)